MHEIHRLYTARDPMPEIFMSSCSNDSAFKQSLHRCFTAGLDRRECCVSKADPTSECLWWCDGTLQGMAATDWGQCARPDEETYLQLILPGLCHSFDEEKYPIE